MCATYSLRLIYSGVENEKTAEPWKRTSNRGYSSDCNRVSVAAEKHESKPENPPTRGNESRNGSNI